MPDPLEILKRTVPDFMLMIKDQVVCDYGCGHGEQVVTMALSGAKYVHGVDTCKKSLAIAVQKSVGMNNVKFSEAISNLDADVVISQNAMEHFPDPYLTFKQMKDLVKPGGVLIITFGPPWYAPYGSHMQFFTPIPWINLLLPECLVMKWRSKYRQDGAKKYEDVEQGLNKMSTAKFEGIILNSGMKVLFKKYECVKQMDWLAGIPVIRELFINHITVILRKV